MGRFVAQRNALLAGDLSYDGSARRPALANPQESLPTVVVRAAVQHTKHEVQLKAKHAGDRKPTSSAVTGVGYFEV